MDYIKEVITKWIAVATWPAMIIAMAISYSGGPGLIVFILLAASMFGWAYSLLFWLVKKK